MGHLYISLCLLSVVTYVCHAGWAPFIRGGKYISTTGWFSEEYGGNSGRQSALIAGIMCSSHFCDLRQLVTVHEDSTLPVMDSKYWSSWFSDETLGFVNCPSDMVVNGIQCRGHYCDDTRIQCGRVGLGYRIVSSDRKEVTWFSEEDVIGLCPNGYYVSGLQCGGDYCDFLKLNCVRVDKYYNWNSEELRFRNPWFRHDLYIR